MLETGDGSLETGDDPLSPFFWRQRTVPRLRPTIIFKKFIPTLSLYMKCHLGYNDKEYNSALGLVCPFGGAYAGEDKRGKCS